MPTVTKCEKEMCQPRFKNNLCENLIQKFHNTVVLVFNSFPLVVISTAKQDAKSFPPQITLNVEQDYMLMTAFFIYPFHLTQICINCNWI